MRKGSRFIDRAIQVMVRRIVRQFRPDRVILFGSHARGEAGPESDVDLLVVMPVEGLKHKKQIQIRVALRDIRVPKDVIVATPADFEWRKEVPGTIEYPAAWEGKVLIPQAESAARVAVEWVAKAEGDLRNLTPGGR